MKVGKIPDFGGQQSFDEIMQLSQLYYIDEDGNQQKKKRPSLWMLFYDCMQKIPKFQKLKDVIEKAQNEKGNFEQS